MNSKNIEPARIGENQRLTATITISIILHAVLILGVGFTLSDEARLAASLEVIFSHTSTALTPKQADFLAQANQRGGGNHDNLSRPRDPHPGSIPQARDELIFQRERKIESITAPTTSQRILSSRNSQHPALLEREITSPTEAATSAKIKNYQREIDIARLTAELNLKSEQYAKRPTRKFISASTREYVYANYMRAWIDRAERVGNLNYPDEARQRRLKGKVVITVGVRRDGSVESSRILVSSGIHLLDAAALRVIQLAQPFPPLPNNGEDTDILQITRTWLFLPEGGLQDSH